MGGLYRMASKPCHHASRRRCDPASTPIPAVQAGVSTLKVRAQTGHASDAMLTRYVRDGELFLDNAAGARPGLRPKRSPTRSRGGAMAVRGPSPRPVHHCS